LSLSTIIGSDDSTTELGDAISSDQSIWGDAFASNSFEAVEQNMDLRKVLAEMPKDIRATYELLKDQSITEASQASGIPRTTLSSRAKRLRQYLEGLQHKT
jgi:DNA-directed RNA polymerase specialized sigma24 family protein